MQVGIAELKAHLRKYLARVQEGEEIVVADCGRPVAQLVLPVWQSAGEEESRLLDLQRRGLIRLGARPLPNAIWTIERPRDVGATVRSALEAERTEGW